MKTFEHTGIPLTRRDAMRGIIVNVVRAVRIDDPDWGDTWIPEMTRWVGDNAVIIRVYQYKVRLRHLQDRMEREFNFPFYVLESTGDVYPLDDDRDLEPVEPHEPIEQLERDR